MICPKCGQSTPDESTFCMHCGDLIDPLEALEQSRGTRPHCTVCGRELPETSIAELCVECLYRRDFSTPAQPETTDFVLPDLDDTRENEPAVPAVKKNFVVRIPDEDYEEAEAVTNERKSLPKWIFVLPVVVALAVAGILFVPELLNRFS